MAVSLAVKSCFPLELQDDSHSAPTTVPAFRPSHLDSATTCFPEYRPFVLLSPHSLTVFNQGNDYSFRYCPYSSISYHSSGYWDTAMNDRVLALGELRRKWRGSKKGVMHTNEQVTDSELTKDICKWNRKAPGKELFNISPFPTESVALYCYKICSSPTPHNEKQVEEC